MTYLTLAQYQTQTGLSLTGVNSTYLDNKLALWSSQINLYTGQKFNTSNEKTLIKRLKQCGQTKINFGGWLEFPAIEIKPVGQSVWQPAVLDKDFTYLYPNFDTYIDGQEVNSPVTGIDFSCLSCRCKCEQIRIVGDNRWSEELPDNLKAILVELLEATLKADPNAYIGGQLPSHLFFENVKSESDQTRSISFFRDENQIKANNSKITKGVNNLEFASILNVYLQYNYNLNYTFNA